MTEQMQLVRALGGISAVLLVATIIGFVLARRTTTEAGRATVANLNARIYAWWLMIALVGAAFLLGKGATLILFALLSFYALREFVTLTPTRPGDYLPMILSFFVLVPLQYFLIHIEWYGLFAIFIPVYAFLGLPAIAALAGEVDGFLERVAKLQWGVMIAVYSISHAPALLILPGQGHAGGALLVLYLLLVVQLSDVLQYVFGKLFGRHKLAPTVSPSKTVEGAIGGGLAAIGVGAALHVITPFTPLEAAALSSVIVLMGILGGLALSAVKRSLGAKDWGTMIEGHGGVLDRLDSVAFAAPVFFHLTRFYF